MEQKLNINIIMNEEGEGSVETEFNPPLEGEFEDASPQSQALFEIAFAVKALLQGDAKVIVKSGLDDSDDSDNSENTNQDDELDQGKYTVH